MSEELVKYCPYCETTPDSARNSEPKLTVTIQDFHREHKELYESMKQWQNREILEVQLLYVELLAKRLFPGAIHPCLDLIHW